MAIIQGSGGGGKSGGGSAARVARVAVEAKDNLRSKQYAKVLDLVSEGEIEGLVAGLQSVFLDDTPVENADGTFNFDGVVFESRNGTQSQTYIPGFPAVEAEVPVSVEVKKSLGIVRTITNTNVDAARITISVPSLTTQNTTNGDVNGGSVSFAIDVQNNAGGFQPASISTGTFALSRDTLGNLTSLSQALVGAQINVHWSGTATSNYQTATYTVEYREVGGGAWLVLSSGGVSGTGYKTPQTEVTQNPWGVGTSVTIVTIFGAVQYNTVPPSDTSSASFSTLVEAAYEFRIIKTGGVGSFSIQGTGTKKVGHATITGKTSSRYQRAHRVDLPQPGPWDIRVRRLTSDSTSQAVQNKTFWDSYTEITDTKFSYPNSALMGLSVDSEGFKSVPRRGYELKGVKVKVPNNYNPLTREYAGVWDGTFVTSWTDNPAWCFYDIIVNSRYGLGSYISENQIDKWSLYTIAKYCDEFVGSGLGGLEPRFTCNLYLQTREEAQSVLQSMASVFRAIMFWANGSITAVQDAPQGVSALFSAANVVDGSFGYSGSSAKTRHNVALVTWNDPDNMYKQAIEYVADEEAIQKAGYIIQTEVSALGCTSRGQANRFGRAILFTEHYETETVVFKAGLDSVSLAPGEIIQVSDPVRSGERRGGRLISTSLSTLTLDSEVVLDSTSVYTLWALLPDGTVESRTVIDSNTSTDTLTVTSDFSELPQPQSVWVLGSSNLNPELWRVVSLVEADATTVEVTAMSYREDKYAAIEEGLLLEPIITSSILTDPPPTPTDLLVTEELYLISNILVGTSINVSWTGTATYYEIKWKPEGGNWSVLSTTQTSIDIRPMLVGNIEVTVRAVGITGLRSAPASAVSMVIYGLTTPPVNVTGFELAAISGSAHLTWDLATDLDVIVGGFIKIRHTPELINPLWSNAIDIGGIIAGKSTTAVLPLMQGSYLAKWVDSNGNQSVSSLNISTNAPNVIEMNIVSTVSESPTYLGTKQGVSIDSSDRLVLDSSETIGQQLDNISTWPKLSLLGGGVLSVGTYIFEGSVDLSSVQVCRLSAIIASTGYDSATLISERPLVSQWSSIVGGLIDTVDASLYIRTSQDGIVFSAWEGFIVGEYSARAFEFKVEMTSDTLTHNIAVTELSVTVDMPDRSESAEDIVSIVGVNSIVYSTIFVANPAIGITAQNMQTGDYFEITNKSISGFDIVFKNSTGTSVSRTFDYISRSY